MKRFLLVNPSSFDKTVAFLKWCRSKRERHMLKLGLTVETLTDEEFEEAKTFGDVEVIGEKP